MNRSVLLPLMGTIWLAFVGWIGYHFVYLPQQGEVAAIHAQIAQERADQHAQAEVAQLLGQLEVQHARLPVTADPSWLVRETLAYSQESGVQLTSITQEIPQALPFYTHLGVGLQFTATYHQLGAFLDSLERSTYVIRPERMEVTGPSQKDGKATVQLFLSTVYLPPVKTLTANP